VPDELITVSEAARRMGVSRKIVQTLVDHGQLPTVPVGDRVRIPAGAVEVYVTAADQAAALVRASLASPSPPSPP
jgi:excisionase family DNA binding protein